MLTDRQIDDEMSNIFVFSQCTVDKRNWASSIDESLVSQPLRNTGTDPPSRSLTVANVEIEGVVKDHRLKSDTRFDNDFLPAWMTLEAGMSQNIHLRELESAFVARVLP